MSKPTGQDSTRRRSPSREMHRLTFKVPHIDVAVAGWWDAQFDASESLRALIRAEIASNGMTDTVYRQIVNQVPGEALPAAQQVSAEGEDATLADGSAASKQAD